MKTQSIKNYIKKKQIHIIIICLLTTMSLSGCTGVMQQKPASYESKTEQSYVVTDNSFFNKNENVQVQTRKEEIPADLEKIAENENLALYANLKTGYFALQDKKSGTLWKSNPENSDNDPLAKKLQKKEMKSQLFINTQNPLNRMKYNSEAACMASGGVICKKIDNGFKVTYNFASPGITIPVQYTLEKDHLAVEIIRREIKEEMFGDDINETLLLNISLLPYFGAAGTDEKGFMVIPDGSGSVINFNNGKNFEKMYSRPVYGEDISMSPFKKTNYYQSINFPMYGVVKEDRNGMLAIIDSGASDAYINSFVAGTVSTSYNNSYFSFDIRKTDTYYADPEDYRSREIEIVDRNPIAPESIKVDYYPLSGNHLTFADIADEYRKYLMRSDKLAAVATENDDLYLTLYGAVRKSVSYLGIPVKQTVPLTTLQQSKEIVQYMKDAGVIHPIVNLNFADQAEINGYISKKAEFDPVVGNQQHYQELQELVKQMQGDIYLNRQLAVYEKGSWGFSKNGACAVRLNKQYAYQYEYLLSTQERNSKKDGKIRSLLSPKLLPKIFDTMAKDENISGYSIKGVSDRLYSDYSDQKCSRAEMINLLKEGLKSFSDNGKHILTGKPYDYLLKYSSRIENIPSDSSKFRIEDASIPFVQMVLHGMIPYSIEPINSNANYTDQFLKTLQTGAALSYEMIYSPTSEVKDTDLDNKFYAGYQAWAPLAADTYHQTREFYQLIQGKQFNGYACLQENVYESAFGDDVKIIVNYNDNDVTINGYTIPQKNYLIAKKGE